MFEDDDDLDFDMDLSLSVGGGHVRQGPDRKSYFSISEIRVRLLSELKSMKPSDRALISLFISIFPSTITSHVYKIY